MAATLVPLRDQRIDPLAIGSKVTYRWELSAIPGPDPATWSDVRFSIGKPGGAYFSVPKTDMTVTPGGTVGAYTVTIDVPVTEAQSRLARPGDRPYQLDFVSPGGQELIEEGLVTVFKPTVDLP